MSGESHPSSTSEKGNNRKKINTRGTHADTDTRPTYADIVRKMVRFKEGERRVNKKTRTQI